MEQTCADGYAPVRGPLLMMMIYWEYDEALGTFNIYIRPIRSVKRMRSAVFISLEIYCTISKFHRSFEISTENAKCRDARRISVPRSMPGRVKASVTRLLVGLNELGSTGMKPGALSAFSNPVEGC